MTSWCNTLSSFSFLYLCSFDRLDLLIPHRRTALAQSRSLASIGPSQGRQSWGLGCRDTQILSWRLWGSYEVEGRERVVKCYYNLIMYRKYVRKWWLLKRNTIICTEVTVNGQFYLDKRKKFIQKVLPLKIDTFCEIAWKISEFLGKYALKNGIFLWNCLEKPKFFGPENQIFFDPDPRPQISNQIDASVFNCYIETSNHIFLTEVSHRNPEEILVGRSQPCLQRLHRALGPSTTVLGAMHSVSWNKRQIRWHLDSLPIYYRFKHGHINALSLYLSGQKMAFD